MKCNAKYILSKKTGKIGATYPPQSTDEELTQFFSRWRKAERERFDLYAKNGMIRVCQGKIKATILAENEPYFGGTSATLSINFECDTCKHSYYPNLPDTEYKLNEWINEILDNMR